MTKVPDSGKAHGDRPACTIEVTPRMIEAGRKAFHEALGADGPVAGDTVFLREIFLAMACATPPDYKTGKGDKKPKKEKPAK